MSRLQVERKRSKKFSSPPFLYILFMTFSSFCGRVCRHKRELTLNHPYRLRLSRSIIPALFGEWPEFNWRSSSIKRPTQLCKLWRWEPSENENQKKKKRERKRKKKDRARYQWSMQRNDVTVARASKEGNWDLENNYKSFSSRVLSCWEGAKHYKYTTRREIRRKDIKDQVEKKRRIKGERERETK